MVELNSIFWLDVRKKRNLLPMARMSAVLDFESVFEARRGYEDVVDNAEDIEWTEVLRTLRITRMS